MVERAEVSVDRVKSCSKQPLILRLRIVAVMAEFECTQCKCKYKHRRSLVNHLKSKHSSVEIETNVRGAGRSTGSIQYKCYHCGNDFSKRCHLDRHIKQMHGQSFNCTLCGKGCTCSFNLEMHMRTCIGSSTLGHRGGAAFVVQRKRKAFGGAVEVHSVNMNAANQLVAIEEAVAALEPTMAAYLQRHHAYKYQIAVNVIFHKAVDPTILTDPSVTLRTTMVAAYAADVPQLVKTSRNILELLEVYEQNGSGWVFSKLCIHGVNFVASRPASCQCVCSSTEVDSGQTCCYKRRGYR